MPKPKYSVKEKFDKRNVKALKQTCKYRRKEEDRIDLCKKQKC